MSYCVYINTIQSEEKGLLHKKLSRQPYHKTPVRPAVLGMVEKQYSKEVNFYFNGARITFLTLTPLFLNINFFTNKSGR